VQHSERKRFELYLTNTIARSFFWAIWICSSRYWIHNSRRIKLCSYIRPFIFKDLVKSSIIFVCFIVTCKSQTLTKIKHKNGESYIYAVCRRFKFMFVIRLASLWVVLRGQFFESELSSKWCIWVAANNYSKLRHLPLNILHGYSERPSSASVWMMSAIRRNNFATRCDVCRL